ncbi:hypothetical protein LEP1GSC053_4022 [Leptospira interrogans serovar Muenchen str. Brem 129]|nr:hypothetical protein LEP1GSC053_4022 [Leptospira interrogans serovar Muenchen str. Brem 129]
MILLDGFKDAVSRKNVFRISENLSVKSEFCNSSYSFRKYVCEIGVRKRERIF